MSTENQDQHDYKKQEATIAPGPPKKWTVMIYLAGDNNLSEECVWAIKELYRVGLGEDIAVVAQYDSVARGMPVTRYDITRLPPPTPSARKSERQVYDAIRNLDQDGGLGDQARADHCVREFVTATALISFATYCIQQYPANHYMLVLSGHGSGSVGKFFLESDSENRYLSVPMLAFAVCKINEELARVKAAKESEGEKNLSDKLDVIGLDACAMSTVEVGYQLKDVATYMVGAEGFERNSGWPYHRVIEALNQTPDLSPQDLVVKIVKRYVKYYFDYAVAGVSVDQAACDLSRMEALAAAVNELATALTGNDAILNAVILAHWRAQSYLLEDYVDLWDFCDLLQAGCGDTQAPAREACQKVKNLIDTGDAAAKEGPAVLKSCYSGADFQHSHGLSIYFPWVKISEMYSHLGFACEERPTGNDCRHKHVRARDSHGRVKPSPWFAFIQEHIEKSRRPVRDWGGQTKLEVTVSRADSSGSSVRFDFRAGTRFIRTQEDRFIHTQGDRFGIALEPQVKNPPLSFSKDPCIDESDD
jgi:Clostripain family